MYRCEGFDIVQACSSQSLPRNLCWFQITPTSAKRLVLVSRLSLSCVPSECRLLLSVEPAISNFSTPHHDRPGSRLLRVARTKLLHALTFPTASAIDDTDSTMPENNPLRHHDDESYGMNHLHNCVNEMPPCAQKCDKKTVLQAWSLS